MTSAALGPAHFKSRGEETLIFNDGDGTLARAYDNDLHVSGSTMEIIDAGLLPHHGAMAQFDNGTYAVTVADAQSPLPGPHGVKIINRNGQEVYPVTEKTSRIHGNATDGKQAVFGVNGGILVVKATGEQQIIPNPAGFGDVRLGTILEADGAQRFIGYSAAKGIYWIDIDHHQLTPIVERLDILQCKVDYAGNNLIVLFHSGVLQIIDLVSGAVKKEGQVINAVATTQTLKPVLEATSRYIYLTSPTTGELLKINVHDLADITAIQVSANPSKLAILGFETHASH